MIAWAFTGQGRQNGHLPPAWKLGLRTKYSWKNLKSASYFRLIDLILANPVFLPAWNSHCVRVGFTVIVSCSDELAVRSCPLLCLQSRVAKVTSRLFYCCGFYCVTITWQQICKDSLYITVAGVLLHETVERTHLGR